MITLTNKSEIYSTWDNLHVLRCAYAKDMRIFDDDHIKKVTAFIFDEKSGDNPLHISILANNLQFVKALIKAKIDVNVPSLGKIGIIGFAPLILAAHNDNLDIVNALIEAGANVEAESTDGLIALLYATSQNVRFRLMSAMSPQRINIYINRNFLKKKAYNDLRDDYKLYKEAVLSNLKIIYSKISNQITLVDKNIYCLIPKKADNDHSSPFEKLPIDLIDNIFRLEILCNFPIWSLHKAHSELKVVWDYIVNKKELAGINPCNSNPLKRKIDHDFGIEITTKKVKIANDFDQEEYEPSDFDSYESSSESISEDESGVEEIEFDSNDEYTSDDDYNI